MMKTNCTESIFSEPADLGSPTDSEINALAESATDIERSRLMQASLALYIAKMRIGNRTPWRDLLSEFRSSEPARVDVSVVFQDGVEGIQTVVMDRGFGLQGDAQLMFSAIQTLDEALSDIENFDAARHVNTKVISSVSSRAASSDRPNARVRGKRLDEIGAWLKQQRYDQSLDKAALVDMAMLRYKCGETDVKDAARKAGLTRTYRKSTK